MKLLASVPLFALLISPTASATSGDTGLSIAGPPAEAAKTPNPTADEAREIDKANRDFLGVKFSPAFGVATISGRVEEAKIVGTGTDARVLVTKAPESQVVALFEAHRLIDIRKRPSSVRRDVEGRSVNIQEVRAGVGPFLAVQSSKTSAIDAIGVGLMVGFRSGDSSAFNIGVGRIVDPNAKFLATSYVDGASAPTGATEVQLTTRSKWGWMLLASFSF